ncbi:peroxynitrite isomerase THAP4-like isoform X2 [Hypomesus transpacificus]|uniref:peroxynitrite isomerase THAP4-like isoform X2 n=1 Tax=Hypomesus transpacificus TaxID=137520 RepID=UPI001F07F5B6|nr:peroxynitrite isomerase THAP4-like isoform X2 [Hypomesus transpacificus]
MAPTTKSVKVKLMSRLTLGSGCCAVGCNLTSGTNAFSKRKMFRFSKEEGKRRAWINAVRREAWQPVKNSRICSSHFVSGAPSVDPCHPDYVSSVFAHKTTTDGSDKLKRYQRRHSRPSEVESIDSPSIEVINADPEEGCTAVGTDMSMADIDQLQNENAELKRKVALLEKKLEDQETRLQDRMFGVHSC